MKKSFYAFLLAFCTLEAAHAQTVLVMDANVALKPGMYANFNEFKTNNPSIPLPANYQIIESEEKYGATFGGGKHIEYKLAVNKKPIDAKQQIYGFCDGQQIYIDPEMPLVNKKKTAFDKLTSVGRYCTYKTVKSNVKPYGMRLLTANTKIPSFNGGPTINGGGNTASLNEYALDINTGDVLRLSKNAVEEYIATDSELLGAFKAEKKPRQKLEEYIIQYAKKHPEEVKR